ALTLAESALRAVSAIDDPVLAAEAHGQRGLALADAGQPERAMEHLRSAVLLAQNAGTPDVLYRWEWQSGRVLRALGRDDAALAAYTSAVETRSGAQTAAITSRRGFRRDVLPLYEEYADLMLASTRGSSAARASATLASVQRNLENLRLAEVRN